MDNMTKFAIGTTAIAALCVGIKVYNDKSKSKTTEKIKKAVGLADQMADCADGSCSLADGTFLAETKEINAALKKAGAPFYTVCGRKGPSFRKIGDSCNNEENIYRSDRKTLDNWLKKNKNTSLTELVKTNGKSAETVVKTTATKSTAKAPRTKKEKREYGTEMYGPTSRPREYGSEFYGPPELIGPKYQAPKAKPREYGKEAYGPKYNPPKATPKPKAAPAPEPVSAGSSKDEQAAALMAEIMAFMKSKAKK